jgi:D-3-phosphoglycerate dehydrogenase / 2-oxoglutarate reductase
MLLSVLRDLPKLSCQTSEGRWATAREREFVELRSCTVGVVGLGVIGFDVARAVRTAFGSEVVAYDPYVAGERDAASIYPRTDRVRVTELGIEFTDKDALFERADVVTVHAPLTPETEGFIGAEEFEKLSGGYFVNTSRGDVVDESALVDAVRDGELRGVALDVLADEPPDPDHPLLHSDVVMVTPHVAGLRTRLHERGVEILGEKIRAVLDGERAPFTVNPAVYDRR